LLFQKVSQFKKTIRIVKNKLAREFPRQRTSLHLPHANQQRYSLFFTVDIRNNTPRQILMIDQQKRDLQISQATIRDLREQVDSLPN